MDNYITDLNIEVERSEVLLSDYIEDIITGHAVPDDGIPKYEEISTEYYFEKVDDDAKYNILQGAIGDLETDMNKAYADFTQFSHEALSTNTSKLMVDYSNDLFDVMSDALLGESDLSTQTHNMQEYVEQLTEKLIQYNEPYDSVNENLVASKNISIGANWRFKSDTSSLEIQYNPDPTNQTGWQVVPLQRLNTNAQQLLFSDSTSPVQGADKPTIAEAVALVNSIINNGPENRSSLRGVAHQLVHNVDWNLLVVGDNASSFMTHLEGGASFRVQSDSSNTDITAKRTQQGGLVFADLSTVVSNHNTAVPLVLLADMDTDGDGINSTESVTAYYFPFVMPAGNVGKVYQ